MFDKNNKKKSMTWLKTALWILLGGIVIVILSSFAVQWTRNQVDKSLDCSEGETPRLIPVQTSIDATTSIATINVGYIEED
jgi:hypothetical protein